LAKLLVLVCIALQAVVGIGTHQRVVALASCEATACACCAPEEVSCCSSKAERRCEMACGCCARPAERPAPVNEPTRLGEVKVDRVLPQWRPVLPTPSSLGSMSRSALVLREDSPAGRASCGIATTRIVV